MRWFLDTDPRAKASAAFIGDKIDSTFMPIQRAEIVVPCSCFDETFATLTGQLGFRVDVIFPADAPTTAVISGFGVTLRLVASPRLAGDVPITLRLTAGHPLPNISVPDLHIDWVHGNGDESDDAAIEIPPGRQTFIVTRINDANAWVTGRAGMQYRDLIPGRFGGRFVASHIRIPQGGPVPDYVHFHKIRFQMIYCKSGWVRVVYEDQGEPFVLNAGDCVLQPPAIRHRVLEASAGLEVIEIGCPAIHETIADHQLLLPNARLQSTREFAGQRFVRHSANAAPWLAWARAGRASHGFESRNTGIDAATSGLAHVSVVRATLPAAVAQDVSHRGEFWFMFVLAGALQLQSAALGDHRLDAGDSVAIPAGADVSLRADGETEFLEVMLPAA